MKTKEEHLQYCKSILQRGDKIKDVIRYLNHQKVDEETNDEIINKLYQLLEEEKLLEVPEKSNRKRKITYDLMIGIVFILAGLVFIRPFWDRGILIFLPFVILGYGVFKVVNFFNVKR